MTTTHTRPAAPQPRKFRVMGTRPIRHDGLDKVTGRAKYGIDAQAARMLHGAILRSPHAHARIRRIDTSKAERLPGVKAVMTGHDLPNPPGQTENFWEVLTDINCMAQNVMARDKVLFRGHAVAAVAAVSPHVAEEALRLIEVDYEVLPHVTSVHEAIKPGAPVLHESSQPRASAQGPVAGGPAGAHPNSSGPAGAHPNSSGHVRFAQGDIEQGFSQADVIVERTFETKYVHQGYIELINSMAYWAPDGKITIWKSGQAPFIVRQQVALLLKVPVSSIRVVPMEIGGGFGGRVNTHHDAITAVLSKKSGQPVKISLGRKEIFEATGPAPAAYNRVRIGATKDGMLVAADATLIYSTGAFPGGASAASAMSALGPYRIPHLKLDGFNVVTNTPWCEPYRAPGVPQAAHATEQVIDELAQRLNMDPMALRLKNVSRTGDRQASGVPFPSLGMMEVEQAMASHPHYRSPLPKPRGPGGRVGRGVAMAYWGNHGMQSSATLSVNSDGTVTLVSGSVDIGGSRPALAIQAAEVLGIAAEEVIPSVGDTDSVGYTAVTGGSRTAHDTGIAVITAAQEIINRMRSRAAILWETQAEGVEFRDGVFSSKANPKDRLTFKELAKKLMQTGGPVSASASVEPKSIGPSSGGLIVDVEVDPETGKVDVLRATVFQDAGKAAHPSYVEGQMQGGTVQGIGWALNEEYCYNEAGALTNGSFLDYRMPIALDLPMIQPVIVEVPSPGHPFGMRGVGECSIVAPLAAVSNAVSRAVGVRMTQLPLSPAYIVQRLKKVKG